MILRLPETFIRLSNAAANLGAGKFLRASLERHPKNTFRSSPQILATVQNNLGRFHFRQRVELGFVKTELECPELKEPERYYSMSGVAPPGFDRSRTKPARSQKARWQPQIFCPTYGDREIAHGGFSQIHSSTNHAVQCSRRLRIPITV